MSNEIVKILAEADKAEEGYVWRNGCVMRDDGGPGEILQPESVVELSDGSLFTLAHWIKWHPVRLNNGRIALWDQTQSRSCPVSGLEMVEIHYGKDFRTEWVMRSRLTLVFPTGEDKALEDFIKATDMPQ